MEVTLTTAAAEQLEEITMPIHGRVMAIIARLEKWPEVSGAKPLRKELQGSYRIRTGAYRVVFQPSGETVVVTAIDNRRDVYE